MRRTELPRMDATMSGRSAYCLAVVLLTGLAAPVGAQQSADKSHEESFHTTLLFAPPETVQISIRRGMILMPNRDGYQPLVVTNVTMSKPSGIANELTYDPAAHSFQVTLQGGKVTAVKVDALCMVKIAKPPSGEVGYRLTERFVPVATLDGMTSNIGPGLQATFWDEMFEELERD